MLILSRMGCSTVHTSIKCLDYLPCIQSAWSEYLILLKPAAAVFFFSFFYSFFFFTVRNFLTGEFCEFYDLCTPKQGRSIGIMKGLFFPQIKGSLVYQEDVIQCKATTEIGQSSLVKEIQQLSTGNPF